MTLNKGKFIGSHMSIAGGVENALIDMEKVEATALQLFVKNNNQWRSPAIAESSITAYFEKREAIGIKREHIIAHAGYLINLAGTKADVTAKSLMSLEDELRRCGQLDIYGLVLHPGSHLKTSTEEGIDRLSNSIRAILTRQKDNPTRILFETMVGNGSQLGSLFQEIRDILDAVDLPEQTGVCLDTCHIFAAGYDIRTKEGYEQVMGEFDSIVGINRLGAIHLNDSKFDLGERKDRHEHIGQGFLGDSAFENVLNDKRLAHLPMVLETPKGDKLEMDIENLNRLRSLIH